MKTTAIIRSFNADFAALCRQHENSRALLDAKTGRVWTYGMLKQAADGAASALARAGAKAGSRVLSVLPNGPEQFAFFLGAWVLGADFCPVSPLSTPAEVLRFADLCRASLALVPAQMDAALAGQLERSCGRSPLTVVLDGDLSRWFGAPGPRAISAGRVILFTSGTASEPKAIVINADRLWSSACAWTGLHSFLSAESRFFNILPMSYLGGLFNLGLIPLACGGSFVVGDAFTGLTAIRFWREVAAHGINTLWLAPTMMRTLSALHKNDPEAVKAYRQVRAAFIGMAPVALAEKERFEKTFGFPVLENFALSETTFLTSERLDSRLARAAGSVGQKLPWVDLQLDPSGDAAAAEVMIKSPFLFEGYLKSDGSIELPVAGDGWFRTGDLAVLEDGETLIVKGRSRDIVKKGGYLIVLRELEEAAQLHPAVVEAAAVGVPHDFYGESAILFVRLQEGKGKAELEAVARQVSGSLAKFKWPSELIAVREMPKTESGKTRKRLLSEKLNEPQAQVASVVLK